MNIVAKTSMKLNTQSTERLTMANLKPKIDWNSCKRREPMLKRLITVF